MFHMRFKGQILFALEILRHIIEEIHHESLILPDDAISVPK